MIYAKQAVSPQFLTTDLRVYYTAPLGVGPPVGTSFIPTGWTHHNVSSGAATLTIYIVPKGESPQNGGRLCTKTLTAGQFWTPWELLRHVLNPGDTIQMMADKAAAVTVIVSGYEQTQT
jgi:hypothetical protein